LISTGSPLNLQGDEINWGDASVLLRQLFGFTKNGLCGIVLLGVRHG
jgi:hypothetical protein